MTVHAEGSSICGELESHRVFAGVPPQTVAAYRSVFAIKNVRRLVVLFDQGDDASAVFLVGRGRIALNRVARCGRQITPALLGPGSIVGADALSERGCRRSARATAITDSTGLLVSASDFMRILAHDGTVASNIVRILCLQ